MPFAKKCPLCSAKMSKVNGVLTCPDCGYNESFSRSSYTTASTNTNPNMNTNAAAGGSSRAQYQSSGSAQAGASSTGPFGQSSQRPYEQYLNQQQGAPAGQSFAEITAQRRAVYGNEKSKASNRVLVICLVLIIVFIGLFVSLSAQRFSASDSKTSSDSKGRSAKRPTNSSVDNIEIDDLKSKAGVPQSEFFSQTASLIFDKAIDDISASDMEQVVSLRVYEIHYDYSAVDYTLADGTGGTVYPVSQKPDVSSDLTCFVNLEELYLEDSYGVPNLGGLDKLHTLYMDDSINDIETAPPASQLTALGLYDLHFSFPELSAFTNVESLYIDSSMLSSIDGISKLPSLKRLTIVDGDHIDDLSALYQATQLEALSIESRSLRDIRFLTKFDNLTELTIIGSEALDFNPLAECTKLEKLYLLENYKTTDYEFVKGLTGLKEFGLITSFNFDDSDMPDLSALSNVTRLQLGNFESFDNLKYMTNVEELIIDDGGYGDFGSSNALLSLPNLRSLTLTDSSVPPEMIQQISEAEGLEYLDMSSSYLWGSINPILAMPNLKELNLRYASFMLDADSAAANESLRSLTLDDARISKYNANQWADREDIDVEKLQEMLARLPGLETLSLESQKLNSVEFAQEMEQLKLLNITDNYVTSLAPLAKLPSLRTIVCESNPISEAAGLEDMLVK